MKRSLTHWSLALLVVLASSGCANRMVLDTQKKSLPQANTSIGIFTLRTENTFKPSFEPEVRQMSIVSENTKKKKTFQLSKAFGKVEDNYLEYLVSVDLDPGGYAIENVKGVGGNFWAMGNFNFPVNSRFNLGSGVTYLGHLKMINRERKEGEERSGGLFPLIDQAASGFYAGTFDITISDRSETDIPMFVQVYPLLKDVTIGKSIMQK